VRYAPWRVSCIPDSEQPDACATYDVDNSARELMGRCSMRGISGRVCDVGGQGRLHSPTTTPRHAQADGTRRCACGAYRGAPGGAGASAEELQAHEAMLALITKVSAGAVCGPRPSHVRHPGHGCRTRARTQRSSA